ncbi:MAG: hypothetical protein E5V52_08895 [Mesorhizobium sp.]|nr:MAG: hypothetical protein E5V52_08895 [Mesorhizobium sp.]
MPSRPLLFLDISPLGGRSDVAPGFANRRRCSPRRCRLIADVERGEPAIELPISPLEGEMSGRTERGASPRPFCVLSPAT